MAIFQCGFDRWVDDPDAGGLPTRIREAADELAGAVAPNAVASRWPRLGQHRSGPERHSDRVTTPTPAPERLICSGLPSDQLSCS